jgi:phage protein D
MTLPPGDGVVPSVQVLVRSVPLPGAAAADLVSATVHLDSDLPGMCVLRLWDWDIERQQLTWSDSPVFEPGAPVEVRMGYVGALRTVFVGEITGIEVERDPGEPPTVTVRCYDLRHRLMRGQQTRTFVDVADSAIARQIATEHGMRCIAVETKVKHEHVLQRNQTDLDFLRARAEPIGYEVVVEDHALCFRPLHRPRVLRAVFKPDDLIDFQTRLTTMGQTGGLVVQGRSLEDPSRQLQARRGGGPVRDDPLQAGYRIGTTTTIRPLADLAEANAVAEGQRDRVDPWRIVGSGRCIGRADLRAGDALRLAGFGRRFSGTDAVTSATHSVRATSGYITSFDLRKDPL